MADPQPICDELRRTIERHEAELQGLRAAVELHGSTLRRLGDSLDDVIEAIDLHEERLTTMARIALRVRDTNVADDREEG